MHSLGIVQWNFTRRDHPGNPGRVSGSGPVKTLFDFFILLITVCLKKSQSNIFIVFKA